MERGRELTAVRRALSELSGGRGGFVVIDGPSGIGKSSLLRAVAAEGADLGSRVLAARASQLDRDVPFGIARQLLVPALAGASTAERDELLAGAASLAASPLGLATGTEQPTAGGLASGIHGLVWLTVALADLQPLVLVVDDVQWADEASCLWLANQRQQARDLPVLIVVAHRSDDLAGPGSALGELLGSTGPATELALRPLGRDGVSEVVTELLPHADDGFVDSCLSVTGGNPFLVRELVAAVDDLGIAPTKESASAVHLALTGTVRRNVAHRIARAGDDASAVARALVALGPDADLRRLGLLADLDDDATAHALDQLVAVDVVVGGPPLGFRHSLIGSAVEAEMTPSELAEAHLGAAEILASDGVGPADLAPHLLRAPTGGRPWVVDSLREAADAARRSGATSLACRFLERALCEPPERPRRGSLLVSLGRLESQMGDQRAERRFQEALLLAQVPDERARALLRWGQALFAKGDVHPALERLRGARQELDGTHRDLAAEIDSSILAVSRTDVSTLSYARAVVAPLREAPPAGRTRQERALLAELSYHVGLAGEDRATTAELARRAVGGEGLVGLSDTPLPAVHIAALMLMWSGEVDLADRVSRVVLQRARRRAQSVALASASEIQGVIHLLRGELDEAISDLRVALDLQPEGVAAAGIQGRLAVCLLERGEVDAAAAALDLPGGRERHASATSFHYYLVASSEVALARGDAQEALRQAEECARLTALIGNRHAANPPWRLAAARARLALGDRPEARAIAEETVALLRQWGSPQHLGSALVVLAETAAGLERVGLFREALVVLDGTTARLDLVRARMGLGAALLEGGDVEEATRLLEESIADAEAMGAVQIVRRAAPDEIDLRDRPDPGPSDPVVALARRGLTARETAQALLTSEAEVQRRLASVESSSTRSSPLAARGTTVRLLGGFEVLRDGEATEPLSPIPASAVKIVGLQGAVHAEALAELLWPGHDGDRGRTRLRNVLARVRQSCGDVLVRRGEVVALADEVAVDAHEFDEQVSLVVRGHADGQDVLAAARRALSLHTGDLLPGDLYAEWAVAPRERIRRRRLELLDVLAEQSEAAGALVEAGRYLQEAIDAEPYDEERYLRGAELLARQGRLGAAKQLLVRAELAAAELGVEPSGAHAGVKARLGV